VACALRYSSDELDAFVLTGKRRAQFTRQITLDLLKRKQNDFHNTKRVSWHVSFLRFRHAREAEQADGEGKTKTC
jgi:hypothetical protein